MKKAKFGLFLLVALMVTLWSCEKDDNVEPAGQWELTAPVLKSPAAGASIVLDESNASSAISFEWDAATSSAGYSVTYKVYVDTLGSTSFETPIIELTPENNGAAVSVSISQEMIDDALSILGYTANSDVQLTWAVVATSMDKVVTTTGDITIKRFATEKLPTQLFISGAATENGSDIAQALPFRRLNNAEGNPSNKYEIYTSLEGGKEFKIYSAQSLPAHNYGGAEGAIAKSGAALTVDENGQYRISLNFDDNTYEILKIEKWSMVGSPINGGWGGDEPLDYKGAGVWEATIDLVGTGGFLFRANENWDYVIKMVENTTSNEVVMESQAADLGLTYVDLNSTQTGSFIVTLDLSANAYTYSLQKDPNSTTLTTPDALFLLADGANPVELTKDGDVFRSNIFIAMQTGVNYTLNTANDGSGTSYAIDVNLGVTESPDGDKVSGNENLSEGSANIVVERDQAYQLNVDFSSAKLNWSFYNIKIFHWDEAGGGWDARTETLMTYSHPYTFTATDVTLTANYDTKFNSPWDIQLGFDAANGDVVDAASGSATNGGANFSNIPAGTYTATLVVANDFSTATYEFN